MTVKRKVKSTTKPVNKNVTDIKPKEKDGKIVMTLGSLQARKNTLNYALEQKYHIKMSYRLGKIVDKIDSELRVIEKKRLELVNKYGKEDKKIKKIIVPDNKLKPFAKELEEFLEEEIFEGGIDTIEIN